MHTRARLALGSIVGAVAIHFAMVACSSGGDPSGPMANRDAGALADALADVRDALSDVVADVLDAETADAHAGGDGGTPPACNCVAPPEYTFSGGALQHDGMATQDPQADFSTVTISNSPARGLDGALTVSSTVEASYFLADGSQIFMGCTFDVRMDRTIVARSGDRGLMYDALCRGNFSGPRGPTGSAVSGSTESVATGIQVSGVRVTELTDTQMTVTLPPLPMQFRRQGDGGTQVSDGVGSIASVTVRATVPGSRWLTTPRAYRP